MNKSVENLDLLSDILQVFNTYLLLKDASNTQIMHELQHQNSEYLERIVEDLALIKKKLGIQPENQKKSSNK